uniref:Laminin, alpha 5 n=1 Tax=Callorhinchus milii TaxID=7868 RepID=A0A4W3JCR4_CALMI
AHSKAHPSTNAIDGTERWWQSPPLSRGLEYNEVNVTLDLGQLFHVAYVLIKFANSPRPDLWVLERSTDFGRTYSPWQYFASSKRDCIEKFGPETVERIIKDNDAICTTEYSRIVPLENGEVVVSLVNGRPGAMNFSYSPVLRDFTKATSIRLRFLRTNTLLGHLMGKALRDPTVTRRYYYSIKDISIGGRCVCNGHLMCNTNTDPEELHCDCQHNTCGGSCDQCCPGYNQLQWKPATTDSANECEACNCNGHAFNCMYDPEVDKHKGSLNTVGRFVGGGVCINCQHNTTGVNCGHCATGYYRTPGVPIESVDACIPCNCNSEFMEDICDDGTGRCYCKYNYAGETCESCALGYYDFPNCYCKYEMTTTNDIDLLGNNILGYRFETRTPVFLFAACRCSGPGIADGACNEETGQCFCRQGFEGFYCELCVPGYFNYPLCQPCSCDPRGSVDNDSCQCRMNVEGSVCDTCKPLYWNLTPENPQGCSICQCYTDGTLNSVAECMQSDGQCFCKPNVCRQSCMTCKPGYYSLSNRNYFGCKGCQCDIGGSVGGLTCDDRSGRCQCRQNVEGRTCTKPDHYFPDLHHLRSEIEDGTTPEGRPVRFGFSLLEFEDFSWRGYALMSHIQNKVKVAMHVKDSKIYLFRFILRYINTGPATLYGSEQTKQIIFAPSVKPSFVTVPQNTFVEPFVLNPGIWSIVIEAQDILLDYLVLLPSAYYEAPILQLKVTEPCMYTRSADDTAVKLVHRQKFGHSTVVTFSDRVQTLGRYAFVIHFYQPEHPTFPAEVLINGGRLWQGYTNASFCPHAYGCRSTVLAENKIVLDVTDNDVSVIIRVPDGKTLWLGYMLIVPETSYNPNYLVEEPLDKSYDFISGCGANSFYVNPATTSTFCKHSAISLSAFYNNGALPCACHEVGASRTSCDPFGGQCICRPNVIGRDCTRCVTGYYGFPNCRPCNCGKRLCEEVTGQCICPPRTIKPECIVCQPQTFGCHPLVGCEECNCSRVGVQNLTNGCNIESGQCRCKPNVAGRQCSRCAPGYYHYPNCMLCDCDEAGTEASVCDSLTGQCHCKENVEGPHCNTCRLGTFYLDPANPKGCTSCFCFGATNRCHSSTKRRSQLVHMHEWSLVSADHHELPVSFNPMEMEVEADLRDIPDVYQELYWRAPPTFLGDQVSSYGGYLTFQLRSEVLRGDILSVPVEARLSLWCGGDGYLHSCLIRLLSAQSNFRHMQTHNPVSREELMMVLASLDALRVRALHSPVARLVGLRNVELERASLNGSGIPASNVEICLCPANYMGDSCQDCARGYYRDTKGLFLGKCVPCNCNGHSDQCLDGSGICINCQHNTEGDRCERCKTGLVEHVPEGEPSLCVQCPCPLTVASNNAITNARIILIVTAFSPRRCAPGYFGNPLVLGSRCQPCTCHGNTDSNMLFSSCDWLTGTCQGCVHHTAGHNCEFCAPGFFGDAVAEKMEQPLQEIKDNADSIRDQIAKHNSKLMDLRDALNEAVNKTSQANEKNKINQLLLAENKVGVYGHGGFNGSLGEFSCICCIVTHQEQERLAAMLDGARMALIEKVKHFSPASTKIPIVERAEEHARSLDQLAANLSSLLLEASCGRVCPLAPDGDAGFVTGDTADSITNAKTMAAAANSTVTSVEDVLGSMRKNLNQWREKYGGAPSDNENFNKTLQEANASGTWQLSIFCRGVQVPMKFIGTSGVQLRSPVNPDDLKAYTSLSFSIQREKQARKRRQSINSSNQFILYLGDQKTAGDYMGVAMRSGKLVWVYKLGSAGEAVLQTDTEISDDRFDTVKLERIQQYGRISYTVEKGTITETRGDGKSKGNDTLLNLDPEDVVFYAGGYPPDFTPPAMLRYPNFEGCIELGTLNEEVISLYNLIQTFNLNTTCNWLPRFALFFPVQVYIQFPFDSYRCISTLGHERRSINVILLLFVVAAEVCFPSLISLQISRSADFKGQGYLSLTPENVPALDNNFVSGFGFQTQQRNALMFYYPTEVNMFIYGQTRKSHSQYFFVPQEFLIIFFPKHSSSRSSFSMEVRCNSSHGMLFYVSNELETSYMTLMLSKGRFVFMFNVKGNKLRIPSKEKYNDGQWHTVFFSREKNRGQLVVDGLRTQTSTMSGTPSLDVQAPFYVGAVPLGKSPSASSFDGCIRNFQLDGKHMVVPSRMYNVIPCFEGSLEMGTFFAAGGGYVILDDAFVIGKNYELMFEVRPRSLSGILFHAGRKQSHYFSLYLENEKVILQINNGAGAFSAAVTPQHSLCDGQWHRIAGEFSNNEINVLFFFSSDSVQISTPSSIRSPFVGCIRNVLVNQRSVQLNRPGSLHGAVSANGCPVM